MTVLIYASNRVSTQNPIPPSTEHSYLIFCGLKELLNGLRTGGVSGAVVSFSTDGPIGADKSIYDHCMEFTQRFGIKPNARIGTGPTYDLLTRCPQVDIPYPAVITAFEIVRHVPVGKISISSELNSEEINLVNSFMHGANYTGYGISPSLDSVVMQDECENIEQGQSAPQRSIMRRLSLLFS